MKAKSFPIFELPKFDLPNLEPPAAFHQMTEKSLAQTKEGCEKAKALAEEAADIFEQSYVSAANGAMNYNLKLVEAARANTRAAFDFTRQLLEVRSIPELIELSTVHARKQFEALSEQTKELTSLAQKSAIETAEPIKAGVTKTVQKVA